MAATTLTDRAILRVSGAEARDFLQGLVTSDVTGPLPVWTGLLTAQGKTLFDFLLWADGDDVLIDCEASAAGALAKRLAIYRLRRAITITRDDGLAAHWSPVGEDGTPDPRLVALGRRWIAPPSDPATAWIGHRLSLGVTEGQAELGDLLWLECNAAELNGVSFTKGCFVGQENTARMNWRAKVNRRLLVVEGSAPVERVRAAYPEFGLSVVHARIDDIPAGALIPGWLRGAIA